MEIAAGHEASGLRLSAVRWWPCRILNKRWWCDLQETDADLGLDLDSPVAKMVNFLRQYQHAGTHIFAKSPTVIEAAAIEKLIFADVARLAAPNLRTQLMSPGNLTSRNREVYRHLLREYFDNGEESSVRTSQSMGSRLSVGLAGQETTPILAQDLSGHSGESNLLCPPVAKSEIARNFFLDAITDDSPLRLCLAPLAAVVEQSVACLKLKPKSDKSVAALRLYIQAIEKGYLHEGYHCLMHAADVTNHLAALLSASGIADSLLPADQPAILGAVVGAGDGSHPLLPLSLLLRGPWHCDSVKHAGHMPNTRVYCCEMAAIHDYNHPQVNNAFLVQEVRRLSCLIPCHSMPDTHLPGAAQ